MRTHQQKTRENTPNRKLNITENKEAKQDPDEKRGRGRVGGKNGSTKHQNTGPVDG